MFLVAAQNFGGFNQIGSGTADVTVLSFLGGSGVATMPQHYAPARTPPEGQTSKSLNFINF
jgi:hypothetical protein